MQFLYKLKTTNLKILLMFLGMMYINEILNIVFSGVAKKDLVNISGKISKTIVQSITGIIHSQTTPSSIQS